MTGNLVSHFYIVKLISFLPILEEKFKAKLRLITMNRTIFAIRLLILWVLLKKKEVVITFIGRTMNKEKLENISNTKEMKMRS